MKLNKRIEIVCSSIVRLSSMGIESRTAILDLLAQHYTDVRITIVNNLDDLEALSARKPDLVFLGMKFIPTTQDIDGDKIWITQYLNDRNITCTGSNHFAHRLELDKQLAKQCVLDAGLKTSRFYVVSRHSPTLRSVTPLSFPLFIKPTNQGGGLGIDSLSVVHNFEQLDSKIQSIATNFNSDSLVEQYLPGREFSVAVLKKEKSTGYLVMPLELIAPTDQQGQRILSAQIKSADTERSVQVNDKALKAQVSELAIKAFHAMGAQDYGRIDIRLDEFGVANFLEANLIPSLRRSPGNYFPKACLLNMGLTYEDMILKIVRLALNRTPTKKPLLSKLDILNLTPAFETTLDVI